ncbi:MULTISPECIES: hypothetical protein [Curtobacterium]|nr:MULTISPECIES: hypothetical protein [Curtobacterium]MCA5922118.1 hypothetical protein [Curtobacterium oceanosedimentum]QQD75453.1 hypothetical protein I8920_11505 [Curtobacterium sp. YC1]
MARTDPVTRSTRSHPLAQTRVRSLAARPVGPLRVVPAAGRTQPITTRHQ